MKKARLKLMTSLILVLLLYLIRGQPVSASVISTSSATTATNIKIIASPLMLNKVTMPIFGEHRLTGTTQVLTSTTDLEINVSDERRDQSSPWVLQYELSNFKNHTDTLGQAVILTLGKGIISANPEKEITIQNQVQQFYPSQQKRLVTVQGTARYYRYIIPAAKIKLTVPRNIHAGNYAAKQTVTLFDTVKAN